MKPDDLGCSTPARCDADLPDSPQCAPNYHFGMLLGVEDFRAEQGFHLGQHRRHQRSLHGAGVVAGFGVSFKAAEQEVRVAPGQAVDRCGRDLVLDLAQCVSLPAWWEKHHGDEAFRDVENPRDVRLDLDVRLGWCACLASPVPAIADPCAGDAADVAYSRVCETVQLGLARTPAAAAAPDPRFHLLRMWLLQEGPTLDADGQPLPGDRWLIDRYQALVALPPAQQAAERDRIAAEVLHRAVAEPAPDRPDDEDACLTLATLKGVHLWQDAGGWHATVAAVESGARLSLLPTSLLQALLLSSEARPPAAGPEVARDGLVLAGTQLTATFTQPLAAASVTASAFAVHEFVAASGWQAFTATPGYSAGSLAVTFTLDRAPAGKRLRLTVYGNGPTPLLGAALVPAGALTPESDGRTLSTTLAL